jgi:cell division protein ZapA
LLLADQLIEKRPEAAGPSGPDPIMVERAESLASRLESLAAQLENETTNP